MADVFTKQPAIWLDKCSITVCVSDCRVIAERRTRVWVLQSTETVWYEQAAAQWLLLKRRFCSMQTGEESCLRLFSPQPQKPQHAGNSHRRCHDANSLEGFDHDAFVPWGSFSRSQWNVYPCCCRNVFSATTPCSNRSDRKETAWGDISGVKSVFEPRELRFPLHWLRLSFVTAGDAPYSAFPLPDNTNGSSPVTALICVNSSSVMRFWLIFFK